MATVGGGGAASVARPERPVVALRPLGIGEMLDAAIKVYRSRPKQMIVASAVVTLPAIVAQTVVQLSAGDPQSLTETDPATGVPALDGGQFGVYLGGLLVSTLILIVANNLALAGTTRMSLSAYLGDDTDWRSSLRFALHRFWPLTAVLVLTTLGLLGGFLLCVVPAFWLQGIWAVAVPALLIEELGAVGSLGRSSRLVKGRFWPVLGTIIVGGLLASVLQGVLVGPVFALQLTGASFAVTAILNGLAQFVGVAITTPFVAALTAVVYIDLRVRKEGFDLELLARGVGVDPPADPGSTVAPMAAGPWADVAPQAPPGGWIPAAPRFGWSAPAGDDPPAGNQGPAATDAGVTWPGRGG